MKFASKAIIGLAAVGAAGAAGYLLLHRKEHERADTDRAPVDIHGSVSSGFEPVRDAFAENFAVRREVGAACCVYHKGEKVVDLWGGVRNVETGEPWEEDTMALVYSATKGPAAMTLALAHSRGWLDYDETVAHYWPEFAQNGKEKTTIRQLLAHQAGLFALDVPLTRGLVSDADELAAVLARQTPAWEPGSRQAYHAVTIGFYEGELLRRVDPQHRSLGRFFQEEIAAPLGLDLYIRLPESIPDSRLATLIDPSLGEMLLGFPLAMTPAVWNPRSNIRRALAGSELAHDKDHIYPRNLEIPAGGGVMTARSLARAYSEFATGGKGIGLSEKTLSELEAPARPSEHGFYDECMKGEAKFSLGFMKSSENFRFGSPEAFGAPGAGGSLGFADPARGIGYAYIPNRKSTTIGGDPRDVAIRKALFSATPAANPG
jgi:CubicO group peptidase (beta-lactamase class C family)